MATTITLPILHFNDVYNMTDRNHAKVMVDGKLTDKSFNIVTRFSEKIKDVRARWEEDVKDPKHAQRIEAAKKIQEANKTEATEKALEVEHGLVLFSGDLFSPSVESLLTKGRNMVHLMNELAPDACVPGNHEFDLGRERFEQLIEFSNFNWILSNLKQCSEGKEEEDWDRMQFLPGLHETCMFKCNGLIIGVIGLMSKDTLSKVMDANKKGLKDREMEGVCMTLSRALREKGCDIVLALTHAEHDEDIKLGRAVNAYPLDKKPNLMHLEGVDAIFGGHNHEYFLGNGVKLQEGSQLPKDQSKDIHELDDGLLIVKSGYDFRDLSQVKLKLVKQPKDARRKYVIQSLKVTRHRMINNNQSTKSDESTSAENLNKSSMWKALHRLFQNEVERGLEAPVARLRESANFPDENPRTGETAIGNWIADMMLRAYIDMGLDDTGSGLDPTIFIMTGGSIRSNIIPKTCTTGDIIALLPFVSPLITVEVSGESIIQALKSALSGLPLNSEDETGGGEKSSTVVVTSSGQFPVVSGIRVERKSTPNPNNDQSTHYLEVKVSSAEEEGKWDAIDPDEKYVVLTNNYLVDKNTGFRSFQNPSRKFNTDISMFQALLTYLDSAYLLDEIISTMMDMSQDQLDRLPADFDSFLEELDREVTKKREKGKPAFDNIRPILKHVTPLLVAKGTPAFLPLIKINPVDGRMAV
ncbi:Metallo-dependent phosphatase-like protein [Rhizoctonia solani]|nr:Metallo-dependent phosphatase-like protein [Rhizoctonia solani]